MPRPLSGDKSPLLASPLPAARGLCTHTHVRTHKHTRTECIFVLFDGKGIFSHRLAVSIETPKSGVGHLPAARSTRSTCTCGCARPGVHVGHGQCPPGTGCRHEGIAACPLRHFHVYNGKRQSRSPKSLQFYCFHGNLDTWRGARILLQPSEARGRGEKKPWVCVNERGCDGTARVCQQQHPYEPTRSPIQGKHTHVCVYTHAIRTRTFPPHAHRQRYTRTPAPLRYRCSHGVRRGAVSPAA